MSLQCRRWSIGAALAIELGLSASVAPNGGRPSVLLYLANHAGASSNVVVSAKLEVIRIYREIGVKVIWTEQATSRPNDPLIIIIRETGQWVGPPAALGVAMRGTDSPGRVAYVFYDRVQPLAVKHQMSDGSLLGVVIAHEAGHLLLPYGSHSPSGLMQADWDEGQFFLARAGLLRFTAQQAELIRARLARKYGTTWEAIGRIPRLR